MSTNKYTEIINKLDKLGEHDISKLMSTLGETHALDECWSGSFLGYQSRVYYNGLEKPPVGAVFNTDWGFYSPFKDLGGSFNLGGATIGDWVEYEADRIVDYILSLNSLTTEDLKKEMVLANNVKIEFDDLKSNVLSLISSQRHNLPVEDKYLDNLIAQIENLNVLTEKQLLSIFVPRKMKITSSDTRAIQEKIKVPPHIALRIRVAEITGVYTTCKELQNYTNKLIIHINNIVGVNVKEINIEGNVFIGHGRSKLWLELKDFIKDKLHLTYDEFNRVPVAGIPNITRLNQMLDQSRFAFILMTAEDEMKEGTLQARMNVIHEAGLFQGRLGFEKAILLIENGCEEFSNINGLGQIRFPEGKISAVFQDIREVLERENIIKN